MYFKSFPTTKPTRNSIGGYPWLPRGTEWPLCPDSGKPMTMFLQFDAPEYLGFANGYHVAIFMSPDNNDVPFSELLDSHSDLPADFWKMAGDHVSIICFRGDGEFLENPDPYLLHHEMKIVNEETPFQISGKPNWLQDKEIPRGKGGEKFHFLLQIDENHEFKRIIDAQEQDGSFSDDYCLFLGNQVYFFLSEDYDEPVIWIGVQS